MLADRPLSVECDLKEPIDRETALAAIDHFPRLNGGIALCLTVYNETAEALHSSFVGLADSVRFLRCACPGIPASICAHCSCSSLFATEAACRRAALPFSIFRRPSRECLRHIALRELVYRQSDRVDADDGFYRGSLAPGVNDGASPANRRAPHKRPYRSHYGLFGDVPDVDVRGLQCT